MSIRGVSTRAGRGRAGLVALLIACIAVGVGLRLESVRHKHTPSHDESISFIAATCHQDAYEREAPIARTVPASEWQRFWTMGDAKFCFAAIGRGLAHTDLHPPLYFWLLHVWSLVFGAGLTQGVALNCLLAALTALALFGLGRTALRNDWEAGLLAALWVLSPATVAISTEARQYDLFALVTVLFVWQLLRIERLRRRDAVLLALATAAGMLTHYLFALVLAGALVIALVRRRFRVTAIPVLGGLVLAALLHPGFTQSLEEASNRGSGASSVGDRLDRVLNTLGSYVTGHAVRHGKVVAIVMLLALAAFVALRRRAERWELPFLAVWIGGGIALLYLAGLSPGHAMGVSYLAPAWPFFAAVPILLIRGRPALAAVLVAGILVSGVVSAVRVDHANARLADPERLVRGDDPILLDTVKRGLVPPALWHVDGERPVFAADQATLLERQNRGPLLYISTTALGGTKANRKRILGGLHGVRKRGAIVLWDPENSVGGTTERVYRAAR
jgi:hypothetical protein